MNNLTKTHRLKHGPSPVYGHTFGEIYQDAAGQYWLYSTCPKVGCPGHKFSKLLEVQVLEWVKDGEALPVKTKTLAYLAS